MSGGETNLQRLLAGMRPELGNECFVFCTFPDARYGDHADLAPVASVQEVEGLTLVVEQATARQAGLAADEAFRRISLGIHSSLDAVGLTAAIAAEFTAAGISANVIAGYFHDHVFVQTEVAEKALTVLETLSARARRADR